MEKGLLILLFNVGISCIGLKFCLGYKIHQQNCQREMSPWKLLFTKIYGGGLNNYTLENKHYNEKPSI